MRRVDNQILGVLTIRLKDCFSGLFYFDLFTINGVVVIIVHDCGGDGEDDYENNGGGFSLSKQDIMVFNFSKEHIILANFLLISFAASSSQSNEALDEGDVPGGRMQAGKQVNMDGQERSSQDVHSRYVEDVPGGGPRKRVAVDVASSSLPSTSSNSGSGHSVPISASHAGDEEGSSQAVGPGAGEDHGMLCFRACLEFFGFIDKVRLDSAIQCSGVVRPVETVEGLVSCILDMRRFSQALLNYIFCREGLMLEDLTKVLSCSRNELCDMVDEDMKERRHEMLTSLLSPHIEGKNCRACNGALRDRGRQKEVCIDMSGLVQCVENLYQGFSSSSCNRRCRFASLADKRHALYRSCMLQTHLVELSFKMFPDIQSAIKDGITTTPFPPQLQDNSNLALPPDGDFARILSQDSLRVPDGDTLVYVDGNERLTIRIPDVDAHEKGDSLRFEETGGGRTASFDVGLEARRELIGMLYDCQEVVLDMRSQETDGYQRTIREVWLRLAHDQPLEAASQIMLQQGQAFPYVDAEVAEYDSKRFDLKWQWNRTRAKEAGICRFPKEVVQDKCLRPFNLRKCREEQTQLPTNVPVTLHKSRRKVEQLFHLTGLRGLTVSVVNTAKTWESATFAKQSTIRNAGKGLFVEGRDAVISRGEKIAYYGKMTSEEPETVEMTYVISVTESGRTKHCNALPVRSGALGRFANMVIPREALFDLIRTSYTIGDDLSSVNKICVESANGKFSTDGDSLHIIAKQEIDLRRGDTEIFVDYGFSSYWFGEVLSNPESFLESSPLLSTAIIFAICDKRSKMTLKTRLHLCKQDTTKFHHLLSHPSYSEDFIREVLDSKRR